MTSNNDDRHRLPSAVHRIAVAFTLLAVGVVAFCLAADWQSAEGVPAPSPAAIRIGTYDSRAVAIAYVRSDRSKRELSALMQQAADAKKAGDQKHLAALNAQGESLQIRRHLQGFSNAPVEDILQTISDKLPEVAQKNSVRAITRETDFHDSSVTLVDITDELVKLFDPDAQTLKIVSEMRKQKPLPIEQVAKMPANE